MYKWKRKKKRESGADKNTQLSVILRFSLLLFARTTIVIHRNWGFIQQQQQLQQKHKKSAIFNYFAYLWPEVVSLFLVTFLQPLIVECFPNYIVTAIVVHLGLVAQFYRDMIELKRLEFEQVLASFCRYSFRVVVFFIHFLWFFRQSDDHRSILEKYRIFTMI